MKLFLLSSNSKKETVWESFTDSISKGTYDFEEESDTDAESIYDDLKISKPVKDDSLV